MKIHSDTLTALDVRQAAHNVAYVAEATQKGSRSRAHALEFYLEGTSSHRSQRDGDAYAATWDEWGIVLGELFRRDPQAVVSGVYESGEHYTWVTGGRFNGQPFEAHRQHKWTYDGTSVTGSYHVSSCKCGAITRRVVHGRTFDSLGG